MLLNNNKILYDQSINLFLNIYIIFMEIGEILCSIREVSNGNGYPHKVSDKF